MNSSWRSCAAGAAAFVLSASAAAHTLWISLAPDPGEQQVVAAIAYGDYLPGSELLATEWGHMRLARFEIQTPDGKRADLGVPLIVDAKRGDFSGGATFHVGGDTAQRKFSLADGARGTYQLLAESPVFRYVYYRAKDGSEHYTDGAESDIRNLAQVLEVSHEIFLLKSAFAAGAWTEAEPVKQLLEIVPLTDLHTLRAGDIARLRVLMRGKPWQAAHGASVVTAANQAFGDRWGLTSNVVNGVAEFRLPTGGLWRFDVRHDANADAFPELVKRARAGEILTINASMTTHVRP